MTAEMALRRVEIEAHIDQCRDAAAENIVEIGRWLNRAKDEGVVPHGEWADWVQAHACMSERGAQRAMQIARELPEGSPLARLGVAKLSALLALPASERESVAAEIDAEHASSREVDERIKAIRRERDEALRLVGEQKGRMQELKTRLDRADADKDKAVRAAANNARGLERDKARSQIEALRAKLSEEQAKLSKMTMQMRIEQESEDQADIAALRRQITDKDKEIEQLYDRLDEAQTQLARAGIDTDKRVSPQERILSAIGALITEAGQAPSDLSRAQGEIDESTRQLLIGQARIVGRWAMQIIAACGGEADG